MLDGGNDEKSIDGSSTQQPGGMCRGRIVSQQSAGLDGENVEKILLGVR